MDIGNATQHDEGSPYVAGGENIQVQLDGQSVTFSLRTMASVEHLQLLRTGSSDWNRWRTRNPKLVPDLTDASISGLKFDFGTDLSRADLRGADLSSCDLSGANLQSAQLARSNLRDSSLRKARLQNANLDLADLTGANLHGAILDRATLRGAKLVGCQLDVKSIEGATLAGAILIDAYVETSPLVSAYSHASALALLDADDLDKLDPVSAPFIERFVADAFETAHRWPKEFNVELLDKELDRIKPLTSLYRKTGAFSTDLIQVVGAVDSGLIEFLRREPKRLHDIHWRAFEEVVAEILKGFGWTVELTQPSKDGGYDLLGICKDVSGVSSRWIVECKRWHESRKVGIEVARSLYTVKNEMRVSGAILATTSDFTQDVRDYKASRYDFDLKNYAAIVDWLKGWKR